MSTLLGFAPFIVFALFDSRLGVVPALGAAAVLSAIVLVWGRLEHKRSVKLLEIGTLLLFGGLALYAIATHTDWSLVAVRLRVDAGLLIVVLVSMAVRQPFTLQYAKEQVPPEVWALPSFMKINNLLTAVWALAFGLMVLSDLAMVYLPTVPLWVGVAVTVVAIAGAIWFTAWYPKRVRARLRTQS
ncbi:MAG: hypothetical protein ABI135_08695 [Rhodoferax sp.]